MTILLCSARCSFVFYVEDLHSKRRETFSLSKLLSIWSWMEALNWPEKRKDKTRTKSRICREFSSVDELMSHGRKSKPFRLPEKGFELGIYIIWLRRQDSLRTSAKVLSKSRVCKKRQWPDTLDQESCNSKDTKWWKIKWLRKSIFTVSGLFEK